MMLAGGKGYGERIANAPRREFGEAIDRIIGNERQDMEVCPSRRIAKPMHAGRSHVVDGSGIRLCRRASWPSSSRPWFQRVLCIP